MESKNYPATVNHPTDLVPHTMQEGRLRKALTDSTKGTIDLVSKALEKAHSVMGMSFTPVDILLKSEQIIEFVLKDYHLAWTDDLIKAIEWGSFGKLESKNELTTISPRNVFQWYQLLRKNFPADLSRPMLSSNPAPLNQMPEPSETEKQNLIRDFFQKGITDPDSIIGGFDAIFKKFIVLKLYSVNADNMETEFRKQLARVAFAFKIETAADQRKKGQLIQLQNMVNNEYKDKIDFKVLQANENLKDAFILVSDTVKKEIVKEIMKTNTVESVMKLYDETK